MKMKKHVKLSINRSSNQCRLSVPQCYWENMSKSGWYEITENNGILTYTPSDKPNKIKIPILPIGKQGIETSKQKIESNEIDYFKPTIDPKQNTSDTLDYAELSSVPQQHLFDEGDVWGDEEVST